MLKKIWNLLEWIQEISQISNDSRNILINYKYKICYSINLLNVFISLSIRIKFFVMCLIFPSDRASIVVYFVKLSLKVIFKIKFMNFVKHILSDLLCNYYLDSYLYDFDVICIIWVSTNFFSPNAATNKTVSPKLMFQAMHL